MPSTRLTAVTTDSGPFISRGIDAVIQLHVPEDVVVGRLMARGRADDSEDVIRRRQQIYTSETAPLLEYYSDILTTVDGVGDVDEVAARVLAALRDRS